MKLALIGYAGSGKSTFAHRCAALWGCKAMYLDALHWLPGWTERPKEEELSMIRAFMDGHSGWVIDGNYSHLLWERRLKEADAIVFFNFPRLVCLWQAFRRYRAYRGQTRPDMGQGCREKLDWEFARWILWDGRIKRRRQGYRQAKQQYPGKFYTVKTHRQAERVFRELQAKTGGRG